MNADLITTTAGELLSQLQASGVIVTPALDVDGSTDTLTEDIIDAIRQHKPGLLALLVNNANPIPVTLIRDLRDAWTERMAICTVTGGLTQPEAEAVAWAEVEKALGQHIWRGD